MKRFLTLMGLVALLAVLALPIPSAAAQAPSPQTYTVLVGYENVHKGVSVMSFFPGEVTIHAGDTVHWMINSNEIHTVSFGYGPVGSPFPPLVDVAANFGLPMPPVAPSPLALNPAVAIQVPMGGGTFVANANSGLMSLGPGLPHTFDLTFPDVGDYLYVCLVHGWEMRGMVHVVSADVAVPSPNQAMAMGNQEIAATLAQVGTVTQHARAQIQPPTMNEDGTMNYPVMVGYHEGNIDLMRFFPDQLEVRPGDTVTWELSESNDAPHTITFLNGTAAPDDFLPLDLGGGVFALYANLEVFGPSPLALSGVLTRDGFYNSGVLQPVIGPTSFSIVIGDMTPGLQPYECLLHDESGMDGTLVILPR